MTMVPEPVQAKKAHVAAGPGGRMRERPRRSRSFGAALMRWSGRIALAAAAAWLLVALANWIATGRFWWWGSFVPLLVFFAGPPATLGAMVMLPLARTSLPRTDRLLISVSAAELAMVILHILANGRTWVWVIPDLMTPPLMFAVLPLVLAVISLLRLRRPGPARAVRWWTVLLALAALLLGVGQAGLNPRAVWRGSDQPVPPGALRVVSWDTLEWHNGDDPARFYRYLTNQRADVYLLQEYGNYGPEGRRPIHEEARLRREFPGYHFANVEGLLTISRYPIAAQRALETNPQAPHDIPFLATWTHAIMRTDLQVNGRIFSMYNVHFYDLLHLYFSPMNPKFYESISVLDRERERQFDILHSDIVGNSNPLLVSGNFNVFPNMNRLRSMNYLEDAGRAVRSPYPTTLTFSGLRLWRMDWTFTSSDVKVHQYRLRSPVGMSSHHLQYVTVSPVH
jgi:hypothetical protein